MSASDRAARMPRRRLARTLRQYRAKAGLTADGAAASLFCGSGTISRMENGQSAEPLRVKAALELYGAPAEVVAEMVKIAAQTAGRKGAVVRRPYHDLVPKNLAEYFDLEDEADSAAILEGEFVPGLIQIPEYARALISSWDPDQSLEQVEQLLAVRMERQQRLHGVRPLKLRVLISEAALHTQVGGPDVLRAQLEHLVTLAKNAPNVSIRVLPWSTGARPALGRNFTILSFPDPDDSDVIFSETVTYFVLEDETDEVRRFTEAYDRVWQLALDESGSAKLIARAAAQIKS